MDSTSSSCNITSLISRFPNNGFNIFLNLMWFLMDYSDNLFHISHHCLNSQLQWVPLPLLLPYLLTPLHENPHWSLSHCYFLQKTYHLVCGILSRFLSLHFGKSSSLFSHHIVEEEILTVSQPYPCPSCRLLTASSLCLPFLVPYRPIFLELHWPLPPLLLSAQAL